MADISQEVEAFRNAKKGRDVRGSLVSLAEKVNAEVETNTMNATQAATNANNAAANATIKATLANYAATNANNAAANAASVRQDILNRLAAGEFKGDQGEQGPQGESGIMTVTSGMFSVGVDSASGDLYAYYPDDGEAPPIEYDDEDGSLYYITD